MPVNGRHVATSDPAHERSDGGERLPFSIGSNIFEVFAERLQREHLDAIRMAGAQFYELNVGYGFARAAGDDPWRVAKSFIDLDDESFVDQIGGWQRELGLRAAQMHAPTSVDTVDLTADDEGERIFACRLLATAARAAARLEISPVAVHPSIPERGKARPKRQKLAQLRRSVEDLLPCFSAAGAVMALENLPQEYGGLDLLDLVAICEEFSSPTLGICLDTGHALLCRRQPRDAVRACGRWLRCLHIQDNSGRHDDHLLPFDGGADWSGFVQALQEIGYKGTLNLEIRYESYRRNYPAPRDLIQEAMRRVNALYGQ